MKAKKPVEDVIAEVKADRRLLPHVPDPAQIRKGSDRRGTGVICKEKSMFARFPGQRYLADFGVKIKYLEGRVGHYSGRSIDVSQTGILVAVDGLKYSARDVGRHCRLKFKVPGGVLFEGLDKAIAIRATISRVDTERGLMAFRFDEPLFDFLRHRKDRIAYLTAACFLLFISLFIVLMRLESVIYFRFNVLLYLYSILTALFLLSRYLFGAFYKPVPINPDYRPSVTIIIPCFNEEQWIRRTLLSCVDQAYPVDKLDVIIVDDCSTDKSREVVEATLEELYREDERYKLRERVRFLRQPKNAGKREAMAWGIRESRTEVVAFVDSDSFLEPDAIVNLVQPLQDEAVAGVSGRTDVANTYTNSLTKLQAVRYYIAFRIMKAAEAYFDSVMCLSGPLSCYRKSVAEQYVDKWLNQRFLGRKATFGDDRSMTNFIVRKHQTYYQDTAICSTIVPNKHKTFLKQQMRWKRSWLRESLVAAKFMWRKEPFMALSFYTGLVVPVIAPIVVLYNLVYVPLAYRIMPTTFLLGLLMMALMMSFAQLLLRRSKLWIYGLWFCLYYEAVLLWQMPWAWVTFWVSTWGTRATPSDVEAEKHKKQHSAAGGGEA